MQRIKLSVEFYDKRQMKLFQGFPNAAQLNSIVANGIVINKSEFLAYMMFTEQDSATGFQTYNDLKGRIGNRLADIDDYVDFNNGSIQAKANAGRLMRAGLTERIGVSLGLCAVNKIHKLTKADWEAIPVASGRGGHPTFDFEISIASTGSAFIQTENKGSTVVDNQLQPTTVKRHFVSIVRKKIYVRHEEKKRKIPLHQNLYYGTIGVLDSRPTSIAKVWLVDPPAFEINMDARKYKLLARLHYYLDEFRRIGVKDNLTKALEERIKLIEITKDYLQLDNYPIAKTQRLYMDGYMFAAVDTNEAFGRIFITEYRQRNFAYLIAFPRAIMRLIVKQDFKAILEYNYDPDFMNESVQILMRLNAKEVEENKLPNNLKFVFNERKKFYEATYYGKIDHSYDGRIFGLLNEDQSISG